MVILKFKMAVAKAVGYLVFSLIWIKVGVKDACKFIGKVNVNGFQEMVFELL